MGNILFDHSYEELISMDNLLAAWSEFILGKRGRADAQEFERQLMANLTNLHDRLAAGIYEHSAYEAFIISDPKTRSIHKASVGDRVLHRAVYRLFYPFFDRTFISDSFSCRIGKGMHRAIARFDELARKESSSHRKTVWVLKCDVRKFFASIDQDILIEIIDGYVPDKRIADLFRRIIRSFSTDGRTGVGLPLGNLTSQLFANVYLNRFDQFVKHRLKAERYIRYADDFAVLSRDRQRLERLLPEMREFLVAKLHLELHPDKIELKTFASGVDFLGWVHFPDHRVLRSSTRKRMINALEGQPRKETIASYFGLLQHGNTHGLRTNLRRELNIGQSEEDYS
ncbi:TPA: hypothetical protein DDZ10_01955 [Candidatus Uhrbacteria bacterium]|nr:MAG: RNA-directed DNA polymerase [Parcubacteria group bacterium GW2011_GWA2_53_21]OGL72250.1 MAG: hypothetical protein A3D69_02335 [Candidatus Uhrbacteria bacterium RIFCSPHIGHO2_02_FULL_54_11]HBL39413.1 hypothetical protein [Candidatus Uhrbacteria bacterium]